MYLGNLGGVLYQSVLIQHFLQCQSMRSLRQLQELLKVKQSSHLKVL